MAALSVVERLVVGFEKVMYFLIRERDGYQPEIVHVVSLQDAKVRLPY